MVAPLRGSLLLVSILSFTNLALSTSSPAFVNELEHLLVDTGGYNDGGFKAGVTPCSIYNQGAQTTGRQSSAQWVRYVPLRLSNIYTEPD